MIIEMTSSSKIASPGPWHVGEHREALTMLFKEKMVRESNIPHLHRMWGDRVR
jgi:hypothetical protein